MTPRQLLQRGAALAVVALALFRCLIVLAPQVYFDQNPLLTLLTTSGVGPAGSLLLDVLSIGAAGMVLLTAQRLRMLPLLLAFLGAIFVAIHAAGDAGNLRLGSAWIAAIATGVAALHFASDPQLRRLSLALCLGLVGALAVRGGYQVFVEHDRTLDFFEAHRAQQLAAQGHQPGSAAARLFERRLAQPEASAWFGLANVYGSIVAACLPAWLVLTGAAIRRWRRSPLLVVGSSLGLILSVASLALSHSKGAAGAALLGLLVVAALVLVRRRAAVAGRLARWLGPALIALVLFVVVVRGALLGEVIDPKQELSLLFRWQYLMGALRIFVHEPLLGVGPDDFKAAYLIFKPAFSPEEITSPHSVLFDYLATLGVGGAALGALFIWLAQRCGLLFRGGRTDDCEATAEPTAGGLLRRDAVPALTAVFLAISALRFEAETLALPDLVARLAGGALFALLAQTAWRALRRESASSGVERAALLGAAAVLIAHTQIEMTATQPGSAALAFLLLGLAGGTALSLPAAESQETDRASLARRLSGGVMVVTAIALLLFGYLPVQQRQAHLRQAARVLQPAATIRWDLAELEQLPATQQRLALHAMERMLREQGVATLSATQPQFVPFLRSSGLASLEVALIPQAIARLHRAFEIRPRSPEPRLEAARLCVALAYAHEQLDQQGEATTALREALRRARDLAQRYPDDASHHRLAMGVCARLFEQTSQAEFADEAFRHADQARQLDPHSLTLTLEIADLAWEHQRPERARELYTRTLLLNEHHRLDPLKQLDEVSLARARERSEAEPD